MSVFSEPGFGAVPSGELPSPGADARREKEDQIGTGTLARFSPSYPTDH